MTVKVQTWEEVRGFSVNQLLAAYRSKKEFDGEKSDKGARVDPMESVGCNPAGRGTGASSSDISDCV